MKFFWGEIKGFFLKYWRAEGFVTESNSHEYKSSISIYYTKLYANPGIFPKKSKNFESQDLAFLFKVLIFFTSSAVNSNPSHSKFSFNLDAVAVLGIIT